MKSVVLYFPDAVNLKAFVLLENVKEAKLNSRDSLLAVKLTELQLAKACKTYGAIVQA